LQQSYRVGAIHFSAKSLDCAPKDLEHLGITRLESKSRRTSGREALGASSISQCQMMSAKVRRGNFRTIYVAATSHELNDSIGKLAFDCASLARLYVQNRGHASVFANLRAMIYSPAPSVPRWIGQERRLAAEASGGIFGTSYFGPPYCHFLSLDQAMEAISVFASA
jgi:hypothetical protein